MWIVGSHLVGQLIAEFFAEKGLTHAFTVSGAGNIRILDAIARLGKTELICCHHEQACAQAAIGYYRVSGRVAPVIVTMGGGAANVITGVISAYMDSIPLLVIAGAENNYRPYRKFRSYGVQSFDLPHVVESVTKWSSTVLDLGGLELAYRKATTGRFGPVVIEVPMDIQ